ncbi:MAG: hypothetical protein ACK55I_29735 [bacterium]
MRHRGRARTPIPPGSPGLCRLIPHSPLRPPRGGRRVRGVAGRCRRAGGIPP